MTAIRIEDEAAKLLPQLAACSVVRRSFSSEDREERILTRSRQSMLAIELRRLRIDPEAHQTILLLSPENFDRAIRHLHGKLGKEKKRRISDRERLAIFLMHIKTGMTYAQIGNKYGMGRYTVSCIVKQVARAVHEVFRNLERSKRTEESLMKPIPFAPVEIKTDSPSTSTSSSPSPHDQSAVESYLTFLYYYNQILTSMTLQNALSSQ